jgi:hypothetical protein
MGAFNTSDNLLQRLWSKVRSLENNTGGSGSSYEEITLASFQTASAAGTLTAGKTYAITDLVSSWKVILGANNYTTYNGIKNGLLIGIGANNRDVFDIQVDIFNGTILSYYNRWADVRFTSQTMFTALTTGNLRSRFLNGGITKCDFSNYTGTITLDVLGVTTFQNCDFSNSSANFTTTNLTSAATFSGRILHPFIVPNQTSFPCSFANTIQINADGTNNMMATITLASSQAELDYTGFESAGIVKLVPDAGGNTIDRLSNAVVNREYIIISDDTASNLNIGTGVNIFIADSINLFYMGLITWAAAISVNNKVYFTYDGTNAFINNKTSTYA